MRVRDVMSTLVSEVAPEASCRHAAQLMRDHEVGTLVVTAKGHLIEGLVTDRDLAMQCIATGRDPETHHVAECMDGHPTTVDGDLDLERATQMMRNSGHRRLPVTEGGIRVVGMLSLDDVAVDVKHYLDAFLSVEGRYSRKAT